MHCGPQAGSVRAGSPQNQPGMLWITGWFCGGWFPTEPACDALWTTGWFCGGWFPTEPACDALWITGWFCGDWFCGGWFCEGWFMAASDDPVEESL